MGLTTKQQEVLLQPINPTRVQHRDGMPHLEAWDVRRTLIRMFGHAGFSVDCTDLVMLYEQSKPDGDSVRWRAAYRATVTLTIHGQSGMLTSIPATYTETAAGTNMGWLPDSKRDEAHDFAIKAATSQAMKRCATNLGDQFGLSLYQKGSQAAVVKNTLPYMEAQPGTAPPAVAPHTDDEPVTVTDHDPTTEAEVEDTTPEPDTSPTPDPSETPPTNEGLIAHLEGELVAAATIGDKTERVTTVTRLSLEAAKGKVVQAMTSQGVTVATLVDRAFAGEVA